jgi:uncharacterized membrane protein YraQ (UPF0718 family)
VIAVLIVLLRGALFLAIVRAILKYIVTSDLNENSSFYNAMAILSSFCLMLLVRSTAIDSSEYLSMLNRMH